MRCRCHSSCRRSRFSAARHPDLRKVIFQHQFQNQLRILAIRLLLAYSLGTDLSRVSDPQLEVQLRQQPLKPARMPTGFHAHAHLHSLGREIAVELLRLLAVLQSTLPAFASFGIHKRNLLEARMVITTYNHHVRLLSPEPLVGWHHQSLLGAGSRHCYGINNTQNARLGANRRRKLVLRPVSTVTNFRIRNSLSTWSPSHSTLKNSGRCGPPRTSFLSRHQFMG